MAEFRTNPRGVTAAAGLAWLWKFLSWLLHVNVVVTFAGSLASPSAVSSLFLLRSAMQSSSLLRRHHHPHQSDKKGMVSFALVADVPRRDKSISERAPSTLRACYISWMSADSTIHTTPSGPPCPPFAAPLNPTETEVNARNLSQIQWGNQPQWNLWEK